MEWIGYKAGNGREGIVGWVRLVVHSDFGMLEVRPVLAVTKLKVKTEIEVHYFTPNKISHHVISLALTVKKIFERCAGSCFGWLDLLLVAYLEQNRHSYVVAQRLTPSIPQVRSHVKQNRHGRPTGTWLDV
jgi:hypothetical protein